MQTSISIKPEEPEDVRHQPVFPIRGGPAETTAAWHEVPFTQIADIPIGFETRNVERNLAGCVGAVGDNANAAFAADSDHFLQRHHKRCGRCNVIEDGYFRMGRDRLGDGLNALLGIGAGKANFGAGDQSYPCCASSLTPSA